MICRKREKRTIFNLLDEYDCESCINYLNSEEIKIGFESIKVFYMGYCKKRYENSISISRAKLLFKEIIIDSINNKSNNIFLWLDKKDDLSYYYEWFEDMIEYGYKIVIII